MNCPSRTDELPEHDGLNQSPRSLAGDLTTRSDLNGITNLRSQRDQLPPDSVTQDEKASWVPNEPVRRDGGEGGEGREGRELSIHDLAPGLSEKTTQSRHIVLSRGPSDVQPIPFTKPRVLARRAKQILFKFSKFIGPGFMVSVAYIDPGNYSTDVAAGAATKFRLLFIVLLSNIFAVVLQTLALRLGTITGMDLAQNCRAHLPGWLNIALYIMAEAAIIATDIAEVIGSAIALNLLIKIPLVGGCALTIVDVLIILFLYSPTGSMRRLRVFEFFIVALVLGVVICFCIQLSFITDTSIGEIFKGYLPSSAVVRGEGIYLSCGILGATVMPHGLYLGSGIVQSRLRAFDVASAAENTNDIRAATRDDEKETYIPSMAAIKSCLNYSIVEMALSLCVFALFVNSAILIVAGASLSTTEAAQSADLFGIHNLLSKTLAPIAGTIFALALLLSGTSAGIVATIAGQMVSEGALNWTVAPWMRRLLTRSLSIIPSIIIAGAVGRDGLSDALNGSQVALSVILPFVSAPLIYFTCRNKFMTVEASQSREGDEIDDPTPGIGMRNHWALSTFAVAIWVVITVMNVALLVLVGLGRA